MSVKVVFTLFTLLLYITQSIRITTQFGEIEGIASIHAKGVTSFLNLPYAEPPIGPLRWRPTKPLKTKFTTVYNATAFGNACVQPTATHFFNVDPDRTEPILYTEDCLYLNIYTINHKSPKPLLPVLVWIHGGGLTMGTAMVPIYDGSKLAINENIIVVAINYRLGRAAFLIDPLLDNSTTGNGGANGILDMIEALKWTRDNIHSFGGDSHEVTISGESGGGWAVCGLVLSPLAKGLFKRSIQMSGSCIGSAGSFRNKQDTYIMHKKIRDLIGVKSFEEIRLMDMQQIVDAGYGEPGIDDMPSIDGYVFPLSSDELISNGCVNGESVMIGTVFQESFALPPFNMVKLKKTQSELDAFYQKYLFDIEVSEIKKYYPINEIKKVWALEKSYFNTTTEMIQATQHTDCMFRCNSVKQIEIISNHPITKNSVDVYFYQFGTFREPYDSVSHGYDIGAMFGMFEDKYLPFGPDHGLSYTNEFIKVTMKWIGDYVKGIGPLDNDGQTVTVQNGKYLRIVEKIKVIDLKELNVVKERCKLWDMWNKNMIDDTAICCGMEPMSEEERKKMMEEYMNLQTGNETDTCDVESCSK